MSSRSNKKTRFVCISDTHNASPADGAFKLPKGDVLVHAGDLTKQGTRKELRKALDWIQSADFEAKIVVAGNHDVALDKGFYAEHGFCFHNQHPEDPNTCLGMFEDSSVTYLNHESKIIRLFKENGPKTIFKVFGSPLSPAKGLWAFGYQPQAAQTLWDQIPPDTDVLVTHTPPKGHCDATGTSARAGCDALRQTLWRVRPRLAVCGHIHEARGAERLVWKLPLTGLQYPGYAKGCWTEPDPRSKKQSLIDVTSRVPGMLSEEAIDDGDWIWHPLEPFRRDYEVAPIQLEEKDQRATSPWSNHASGTVDAYQLRSDDRSDSTLSAYQRPECDQTCVINAAMMASSWPYKGNGNRRYNKPLVVDINLPTSDSFT